MKKADLKVKVAQVQKYFHNNGVTSWLLAAVVLLLVPNAVARAQTNTQIKDVIKPLMLESNEQSAAYKTAVAELQHPNKQDLLAIEQEIDQVGQLERKKQFLEAAKRIFRLRKVFELAGTNLAPLLPDLKAKFLSGESVGASAWALVAIGDGAWPILMEGMTNASRRVQLASIEGVAYAQGTNAILAFSLLKKELTNTSAVLRLQAITSIGKLSVDPKIKIGLLIQTLESDTNVTLRCMAIKALGQIGSSSDKVLDALHRANKDANESVRYSAAIALREILGNAPH